MIGELLEQMSRGSPLVVNVLIWVLFAIQVWVFSVRLIVAQQVSLDLDQKKKKNIGPKHFQVGQKGFSNAV